MSKRYFATAAALAVSALTPVIRAEDGSALFGAKCVACHTATGAGKAAMKGTNLLAAEAKKRTDEQLADMIAKGGPAKKASHAFEKKGLAAAQVTALAGHVRELQAKAR